jgi:hypothetical protein
VLNGHTETLALHTHGHKATETHYDGVQQNPSAQITRDVYSLAPAQRVDLELNTTDDGLHSYGSGLWMFHDHVEKAFTTNGMGEGGSISLIAYKEFLDDKGTPKVHGMDLTPYFSKKYWERKIPVWQNWADDWGSLGAPAEGASPTGTPTPAVAPPAPFKTTAAAPATNSGGGFGSLLTGLLLGLIAYVFYLKREQVATIAGQLTAQLRDKK